MNEELRALFEADQADRHGMNDDLARRDLERRARLDELLAAGAVRSAEDHFHAAMLLQHGYALDDYRRAHELALRAHELGHGMSARWLAAAALDRWLMHQGKPQKYGTQYRGEGGRFRLWDVDSATTDEERAAWGVPPLAQALAQAEEMAARFPPPPAETFASCEQPGLRIDLARLSPEEAASRRAETAAAKADFLARLAPFEPGDPRPGYLPPGLSPRRTPEPESFCAVDAGGRAVLRWWVLPAPHGPLVLVVPVEPGTTTRAAPVEIAGWSAIRIEGAPDGLGLVLRAGDRVWVLGGEVDEGELRRVAESLPR